MGLILDCDEVAIPFAFPILRAFKILCMVRELSSRARQCALSYVHMLSVIDQVKFEACWHANHICLNDKFYLNLTEHDTYKE
jgi:hypothetical protein